MLAGMSDEGVPPGMNHDQTLGWMAGKLSGLVDGTARIEASQNAMRAEIRSDLHAMEERLTERVAKVEDRVDNLESTRDQGRGVAWLFRLIVGLPTALLLAILGALGWERAQ
jgi:hypothetical protein